MIKIPSIFKQLHLLFQRHPGVFIPVAYALTLPSIGALLTLNYLLGLDIKPWELETNQGWRPLLFVIASASAMGLALLPTTFVSVLTGLIWGWEYFVLLIIAYTLGTILGYYTGSVFTRDQLNPLLQPFPKAKKLVETNSEKPAHLIFLIRLSPVIPFALSNILFSLMNIPIKKVVWWGLLGMLPRTSIAFFTGTLAAGIFQAFSEGKQEWEWIAILLLLAISTYGLIRLFKR
ncbi:TVP38/TMEM64 family protein [Pleomorphovibrio marinus]|uniref:TVP38/TMEM64 family protein n=1 Tax=Pleomorphovibrio marinus TaxID=2164132 RepID=UPI000E0C086F|nr:VTT domain-containing protein [Pleomorphovibrio marinus]